MRSGGCTRREFLALASAATAAGFSPSFAPAAEPRDERSQFFSESAEIRKFVLELSKEDLKSLREEPRKYVRATMQEVGGATYKDIAVHVKGSAGSLRSIDDKPAITLNVTHFRRNQRIHGMAKLHLNNSVQDPSYTTDLLCSELFRTVGVPATRFTHATVSINDRNCGLYCVKEGFDNDFLQGSFGNSSGNFYDGGFLQDIDEHLHRISGKGVADGSDLKALMEASREADLDKRFAKLKNLLDLSRFLSFCALEIITWDWDGYVLKKNNYRIYHDPEREKIIFMPTGMDQMFEEPDGPVLPGFEGSVARGLIETPEGHRRYLDRVTQIMKHVYRPEALVRKLDVMETRLQPVLASVDPEAARDYPDAVNRVRIGIRRRARSIAAQLEQTNTAPPQAAG